VRAALKRAASAGTVGGVLHRVAAGETSAEIAERYGVDHAALVLANGQLGRVDLAGGVSFVDLYQNDELWIPGSLGYVPGVPPQAVISQLPSDAQAAYQTSLSEAGDVAGAYQTLVDLGNGNLCKGAEGCSDAEFHRILKVFTVGLNLIMPGVGSAYGAVMNLLYDFSTQVLLPLVDWLGLGNKYVACKSSGTWRAADVLAASNYGSDVPTQPAGSFGAATVNALAAVRAAWFNCKTPLLSADVLPAVVAAWNATHEGPPVAIYVPRFTEDTQIPDYGPASLFGHRQQAAYAFAPAQLVDTSPMGWGAGGSVVSVNQGPAIKVLPIHLAPGQKGTPAPTSSTGTTVLVVAGVTAAAAVGLWLLLGRPMTWEATKRAFRWSTAPERHGMARSGGNGRDDPHAVIARKANAIGRSSRYRSTAPHLTAQSSREALIDWLQWNDPNGNYRDEPPEFDDRAPPLTHGEAWELVEQMTSEEPDPLE
jgi:hypothetical protein